MSMFEAIGAVLVLGFGGYAVLTGTMQIGDLVAFLMLTAFLYDPVSRLHQLNQLVQAGRAAGERVFEILDEPVEAGFEFRRHIAAFKHASPAISATRM
jgi:ABC-type bacteriocin/lantibiotic exporter with double-glycine peptidase domain